MIAIIRFLLLAAAVGTPLYMIRFTLGPLPTNILECLAVAAILAVAARVRMCRWWRRTDTAIAVGAVLLLAGAAVATVGSSAPLTSLGIVKGWFLLPMLYGAAVVAAVRCGILTGTHMFRALVVGGILTACTAVAYALFGETTYDGRLAGIYLSPNHLAMALAPLFPLTVGAAWAAWREHGPRRDLLFLGCGIALIGLTLYLSRSLGGMLGAGAGTIAGAALLAYADGRTRARHVAAGIAAAMAAMLLTAAILLWHTPRIQDFLTLPERSSLASRVMIWRSALAIGADHPVTGIGPGTFQSAYLAYQRFYSPYLEWAVPQPHNMLLAFWLQTGIVGLTGVAFVGYGCAAAARRVIRPGSAHKNGAVIMICAVVAALTTVVIHGIVDTTYWKNDLALTFWILVALLLTHQQRPLVDVEMLEHAARPARDA